MPKWLFYTLLTVLCWGIFGLTSKAATNAMAPMLNQVLFTVGLTPLVLILLRSKQLSSGTNKVRGAFLGFATGILGGVGNISFFEAFSHGGKASTVVTVTGLYPLVTIVVGLSVLKERLNRTQAAGIVLAIVAIYLFSTAE
jgi:transporter family protein